MVRFAVGALIAATIGGASLGSATSIPAWSDAIGPGGTSGPSGPSGASGPTAPTGPTGPPAPTPCTTPSLRLRCPDLVMSAPSHLHLDRSTIPGRVLLRQPARSTIAAAGPLEIRAQRIGSRPPAVYQAIYDRSGDRHLFRVAARLVFKYVPGERYEHESVGNFSYWKFERAAAFQLWSINAERRAVGLARVGPKVAYCLRDLVRSRPSASSPRLRRIPRAARTPTPAATCSAPPSAGRTCIPTSIPSSGST